MRPLTRFYARLACGLGVVGISVFFLVFSYIQKLSTISKNGSTALNPDQLHLLAVAAGTPVSVQIGPQGGKVAFPVGRDSAYFIVPPGAVDSVVDLKLLARVTETLDGQMVVSLYNFGPKGFRFKKNCQLVHPASAQYSEADPY